MQLCLDLSLTYRFLLPIHMSLIEYLIECGGMCNSDGDLDNLKASGHPIFNHDGLEADEACQAARNAGYLRQHEGVLDLYDLMNQELLGGCRVMPVWSEAYECLPTPSRTTARAPTSAPWPNTMRPGGSGAQPITLAESEPELEEPDDDPLWELFI